MPRMKKKERKTPIFGWFREKTLLSMITYHGHHVHNFKAPFLTKYSGLYIGLIQNRTLLTWEGTVEVPLNDILRQLCARNSRKIRFTC